MLNLDRFEFQPVVIIGAGRSGTNILRDTLTKIPGFATWNCDEINTIWRYGNCRSRHDELDENLANPKVIRFIRKSFLEIAAKGNARQVVEKTCANSLRVGFVNRVIPEAKFVFIIRDGRDVVVSALKRWKAPIDLPYILRKAQFVPLKDVPYYGIRFMRSQLYRFISHDCRIGTWGPCFKGMTQMLHTHDLAEVCAEQWVRCVEKAASVLALIDPSRVYYLRYEHFASKPLSTLLSIIDFLNIRVPEEVLKGGAKNVHTDSLGNWKKHLDDVTLTKIENRMRTTLGKFDYV
jgi:hypothetical protein